MAFFFFFYFHVLKCIQLLDEMYWIIVIFMECIMQLNNIAQFWSYLLFPCLFYFFILNRKAIMLVKILLVYKVTDT